MRPSWLVALPTLLFVVAVCLSGHGEELENSPFSAAVALRITFSQRVRIVSHGDEFSLQSPEGRSREFTFSEGLVPARGTFEVVWDSPSVAIRKTEWLSAAQFLAEQGADEILSVLAGSPEVGLNLDREMLDTCIGVLQQSLGLVGAHCRSFGCELPLDEIEDLPQIIACLDVSAEQVACLNSLARGYFVLASEHLQGDQANRAFAVGEAYGLKSIQASVGSSSVSQSDDPDALFWIYCNRACMADFACLSTLERSDVTQAATILERLSVIGSTHLSHIPPCASTSAEGAVGTLVTIHGEGFGSDKRASQVEIGAVQASVVFWSDTQIEAVVPVIATPHGRDVETMLRITLESGQEYEIPFTVIRGIVFESSRDHPSGENRNQIYVVNPNGSGLRGLTFAFDRARYPELSPDGTMIAFQGYTNGETSLWVTDADGSNPRRLLPEGSPGVCLTWAPDNKRIAFTQPDGFLYSTGLDSPEISLLMETTAYLRFPSWSPDGSKIAVERLYSDERRSEIVILDLETGEQRVLVEGMHPEWSPDGRKLAFDGPSDSGWSIFTVDADASNLTALTCGGTDMYPTWSPDGTQIVFDSGFTVRGLHIMDTTRGSLRSLSLELAEGPGREYCPCWGGVAAGERDTAETLATIGEAATGPIETPCSCDEGGVCYGDVVVTGAGTDYVNGAYTFGGLWECGAPVFVSEDGSCRILRHGPHWFLVSEQGFEYEVLDDYEATPPSNWMRSEIGKHPAPTSTGGKPCEPP